MPVFKSVKDLEKYLKKQVEDTLYKDVGEMVQDVQSIEIEKTVYSVYDPIMYDRRRESGGLKDKNNMRKHIHRRGDSVILKVINETKPSRGIHSKIGGSNYRLAELIEFGHGYSDGMQYDWVKNRRGDAYKYLKPRPFTERTINEIKNKKLHSKYMQQGLNQRGIDAVLM